jgi:hypothetical protein
MTDDDLVARIDQLVAEEHKLRDRPHTGPLDETDSGRLADLEKRLDQVWDLLRQRRARTEFGDNPETAAERASTTVDDYEQ